MCESENDVCPCDECKVEREAWSMWADFLAYTACDDEELETAAIVAVDCKAPGVA